MRDVRGERRHRQTVSIPLVAPGSPVHLRSLQPTRVGVEGPGYSRVQRRAISGALPSPDQSKVLEAVPRQAAEPLVGGPLLGNGKTARKTPRSSRQVQDSQEVSASADHMGRRTEDALLQGADETHPPGLVPPGSIPESGEEAGTGASKRAHTDAGGKLVQE